MISVSNPRIGGSGTLNTIPKWTPDGFTLGDSRITDNGTTIALGGATTVSNTVATLNALSSTQNPTAGTTSALAAGLFTNSGTYSTAGGALAAYGVRIVSNSTKSAGAAGLTNKALLVSSSGADFNYAIETVIGDNLFCTTSGGVGIGLGAGSSLTHKFQLAGTAKIGTSTTTDHAVNGRIVQATTAFASSINTTLTNTAAAFDAYAMLMQVPGTYDCTSAARTVIGVYGQVTSTKSAGSNTLSKYGLYGEVSGTGDTNYGVGGIASGGTTNIGGQFDATGGTAIALQTLRNNVYLNVTSGSVGIGVASGGTLSAKLHVAGSFLCTGGATLGDAAGDAHALTGTLSLQGAAGSNGDVITLSGGLPTWSTPYPVAPHSFSVNYTIPAGYSLYVSRYVEIADGVTLEIGDDADLEIG